MESSQISGEARVLQTEAVDCRWHIRAPPRSKVCAQLSPLQLGNFLSPNAEEMICSSHKNDCFRCKNRYLLSAAQVKMTALQTSRSGTII